MASTLPAFTGEEFSVAHQLLAGRVASMMGRKFEEEDWRQAYAGAKNIADSGWSNIQIDIMHGALGVEHKMLRVKSKGSILDNCGTSLMHPAGTRAIRIPDESDATLAARDILRQYGDLIIRRTQLVELRSKLERRMITRDDAAQQLTKVFDIRRATANRMLTDVAESQEIADVSPPDMRFGWLLWQDSLREFLYFEEPMIAPNPDRYYADWNESGGGTRRKSRNLWVYDSTTDRKVFSITTEAGAKIQPYFEVPPPNDRNLYHFVVQGEAISDGVVRVWLTRQTAQILRDQVGTLDFEAVSSAITRACLTQRRAPAQVVAPSGEIVDVLMTKDAYGALMDVYDGVSDEHRIQLCVQTIRETDAPARRA